MIARLKGSSVQKISIPRSRSEKFPPPGAPAHQLEQIFTPPTIHKNFVPPLTKSVIGEGLLKVVLERIIEGKRPRSRPRLGMIDELIEGSSGDIKRMEEDRQNLKLWMTQGTCRKQRTDDDDD